MKEARFTNVPSAALPITTLATGFITVLLPLTPIGHVLGFEPLSPLFLLALIGILFAYVLTAELTKEQFYAKGQREVGSA